jgi:hypothetical protein
MGKEAVIHLVELIEKPKITLKESFVIKGSISPGRSVKRLKNKAV